MLALINPPFKSTFRKGGAKFYIFIQLYNLAPISHSITRFALYIVTSSRARERPLYSPKNVHGMFRDCSTRQAFHLYKQKANQINEYRKIDISDKNT
jgi:hypothetical protein